MTSIFEQYYGGAEYIDQLRERVTFTKRSALHLFDYGVYDKVLYFANFSYMLRCHGGLHATGRIGTYIMNNTDGQSVNFHGKGID